ncbi:hypothetical protein Pve01_42400 [Planomonospora venezuelensis]|nr:hypothetical protein Pve01_42400 [Planomonospora venezuelensis]
MMPRPSIDMGIRPISPETTNPLTPGLLNSSRYGPTTDVPLLRVLRARPTDFCVRNSRSANSFLQSGTYRSTVEAT